MNKENVIRLAPGSGMRDRPAVMRAVRGPKRLLMIVSTPGLRTINRMQGMEAGDAHLADIGRALIGAAPEKAVVGRLAGAKIAIACAAKDAEAAMTMLAEMFDGVAFYTNGATRIHIGAAWAATNVETAVLLETALTALDAARSGGAHGFELMEVGEQQRDDLQIAREALDAIRAGAASVAMQPIVDAQTPGRIMFREALIRLTRPNGEIVSAGEFMPALEKMGVATEADIAVLNLTAMDMINDPSLRASVNIAASSMSRPGWRTAFIDIAEQAPEAAERLIVEVSEDAAQADIVSATELFMQLRVRGVSLALDDFGAGRTSFQHLRDFRFDMLKIDGGFISGIDRSPDNQMLVSALAGIGRQFDMMVIAEYVETAQEARVLRNLGVDGLQGFLFGKPTLVWDETGAADLAKA